MHYSDAQNIVQKSPKAIEIPGQWQRCDWKTERPAMLVYQTSYASIRNQKTCTKGEKGTIEPKYDKVVKKNLNLKIPR